MILTSLLRLLLSAMSLASFLIGGALAGIGIWLMSSRNLLRSLMNLVDTSKLPEIDKQKAELEAVLDKYDVIASVGIAILIIGGFIATVSVCGGLGAMCNLKILLLVYIVITGVLFVSLVVALIYFGTLKARMASEIQKKLTELQESYLISVIGMVRNQDSIKAVVTVVINFMHIMLKCCGVNSVGDARNSTSWLGSERRIMELAKEGLIFGTSLKDEHAQAPGTSPSRLAQAQAPPISGATGKNVPDWLKALAPSSFTELPAGVSVPTQLPPGFSLPSDFKAKLGDIVSSKLGPDNFTRLFDDALTIVTPITCCQMSKIDDLLNGKYDVKMVFESAKDMSCAFSLDNAKVNEITCNQALLDYISKYQYAVVTVGIILACVMGVGTFAALWIFLFD